jgi:rod shape-determining protein MreC
MVLPAKRPVWIALGSTLVFNVLLLSLQTNHKPGPGFLRVWLLEALVPIEKVVDYGVRGVHGVWDGYIGLVNVRDDNKRLQAENDRLKMDLRTKEEEIKEAARLRKIYGLSDLGISKYVVARVVGRDPSRSQQTVTIDKGTSSGIKQNASVLTPDGVVGRVMSVSISSAIVQLITDPQSYVSGMLLDTRVQMDFKGTGARDIEVEFTANDNDVAVGNELVTSGKDQIHPPGVPLASVTSVGQGKGLFKAIVARPHADMSRLENVIVVTETPAPIPGQPLSSSSIPSSPSN